MYSVFGSNKYICFWERFLFVICLIRSQGVPYSHGGNIQKMTLSMHSNIKIIRTIFEHTVVSDMLVIAAIHDNLFPAVSWKYLTIMFLQRRKVQVLSNLLEIETHHPVGPKSLLLPCITRTLILFWRSLVSPWIACYNAWNAQRRRFVQYIYNVIGHVRSFAQVTTVTFANSNPWLIEFMTTYGLFYIVCICFSARIRPKNMVHVDHRGLQKICRHCPIPTKH